MITTPTWFKSALAYAITYVLVHTPVFLVPVSRTLRGKSMNGTKKGNFNAKPNLEKESTLSTIPLNCLVWRSLIVLSSTKSMMNCLI